MAIEPANILIEISINESSDFILNTLIFLSLAIISQETYAVSNDIGKLFGSELMVILNSIDKKQIKNTVNDVAITVPFGIHFTADK